MRMFFDHVGSEGAAAHFPATIDKKVTIEQISNGLSLDNSLHQLMIADLND